MLSDNIRQAVQFAERGATARLAEAQSKMEAQGGQLERAHARLQQIQRRLASGLAPPPAAPPPVLEEKPKRVSVAPSKVSGKGGDW